MPTVTRNLLIANGVLALLFSVETPTSGGAYTLNRGRYRIGDEAAPFANRHGSSLPLPLS